MARAETAQSIVAGFTDRAAADACLDHLLTESFARTSLVPPDASRHDALVALGLTDREAARLDGRRGGTHTAIVVTTRDRADVAAAILRGHGGDVIRDDAGSGEHRNDDSPRESG